MDILDLVDMNEELTVLLNNIAEKNKKTYTKFVDLLSEEHGSDLFWWVTPFASRNSNLSSSFKDICHVLLAIDCIVKNEELKTIFVNKKSTKVVLIKYLKSIHRKINIIVKKPKEETKMYILGIFAFYKFIKQFKHNFFNYRMIKKETKHIVYNFDEGIRLIDIPTLSSSFKNNQYFDRDFSGIQDFYNGKIYFCPTLIKTDNTTMKEFVINATECKEYSFIIKEKYLKTIDFIKSCTYPFKCSRFCYKRKYYNDIDVTAIINNDLIHGINDTNTILGILNFYFIKNFWESGNKIETLMGWYEGQPSSLGLFIGYQKFYKKKGIGYIGLPLLENQFGFYPSILQGKMGITPKIIGTIGKYYPSMIKQFNSDQEVLILPAFRNKNLFESNNEIVETKNEILVVLSYFIESSCNMINMINETIDKSMNVKIIYKNHPSYKDYRLENYNLRAGEYDYEFFNGDMMQAVKDKKIIISAKTTSGLEILSQGVPLILHAELNELFNWGIGKEYQEKYCAIVYNSRELKNSLNNLMQQNKGVLDKKQLKSNILKYMFTEVNDKTVGKCFENYE